MILTYIGVIKERNLDLELTSTLYRKCSKKILKYLKKNGSASMNEVQNLLLGVTATVPWSRKKIKIQNPNQFCTFITDKLYKEGKISLELKKNKKIITIK